MHHPPGRGRFFPEPPKQENVCHSTGGTGFFPEPPSLREVSRLAVTEGVRLLLLAERNALPL